MQKTFCPHCGTNVAAEEETEFGIFCPKCHNDFWRSECIPGDKIANFTYHPEYNLMLTIP